MAVVEAAIEIPAPLAEVWSLIIDPGSWPAWVDGFAAVEEIDGYPEPGGTVRWHSNPPGRGVVTERVLEVEPRRRIRVAYEDPGSRGEVLTSVEIVAEGGSEAHTRVEQQLDYTLIAGGLLGRVTDRFFIRPQMRRALQRSLAQLRVEAGEPMGGFEPPAPTPAR